LLKEAIIDLNALEHNLQYVRKLVPNSNIIAVIKADGYGHGILNIAKTINTVDAFAVACIDEAVELRQAGIRTPILLLGGFLKNEELKLINSYDLMTVIHSQYQIDILKKYQAIKPLFTWLKIDTGMGRLGFKPLETKKVWHELSMIKSVAKPIRLMTHMACADELNNNMTNYQCELFYDCTKGIKTEHSIANSASILAWKNTHSKWVRPGIMLYGCSPFTENQKNSELKPVMQLQSKIIAIKHYNKGDSIGYGSSYICPEAMPIAIVAIGYGDGYPRNAPSGTPVLINNKLASLVGRVSMDMITIDLRQNPQASIGDNVVLWGKNLSVNTIAQYTGTIGYELLTKITARVKKNVISCNTIRR
jgi:alanine racemase